MAQAVKCFPYKCGDPSLEFQHPQKKCLWQSHVIPGLRRQRQGTQEQAG